MVNERDPKVTTDEIRGATTVGTMRYVLLGSIVLIVIIFAILLAMYR
jgi:hypothetical protein